MLYTYLLCEAGESAVATVTIPSILHLPQAIDCGGGLVNVRGLGCLVG